MIGVFDSGSGGLTVVRALRALAPQVDIAYVADTANFPYGNKSEDEIRRITTPIIRRLREQGATTIVSACNSVSAAVILPMIELLGARQADVIEMVGPTVAELARRGLSRVALLATPTTISSGMYRALAARQGMSVWEMAVPGLAELIESEAHGLVVAGSIRSALARVPRAYRHVLLGCTHYPLALATFITVSRGLGRELTFIDPAAAVAQQAIRRHGDYGAGLFRVMCTGPSIRVSGRADVGCVGMTALER